jgi:hypothetical protein
MTEPSGVAVTLTAPSVLALRLAGRSFKRER